MIFDPTLNPIPPDRYQHARWYACYTRGRHEKTVDAALRQRGIESFLPLVPRLSQWKDRRKTVLWPLFSGYVFGRFALDELSRVLSLPGVAAVVGVKGVPMPIPDQEIESVRRVADALAAGRADGEVVPMPAVGDRVRVEEGSLRGVEGVVVRTGGRARLLVGIQLIDSWIAVDLPAASLAALAAPA
jgi:transcription antitermination factor NusG